MASDNNKPPVMKSIIGITIATGLGAERRCELGGKKVLDQWRECQTIENH